MKKVLLFLCLLFAFCLFGCNKIDKNTGDMTDSTIIYRAESILAENNAITNIEKGADGNIYISKSVFKTNTSSGEQEITAKIDVYNEKYDYLYTIGNDFKALSQHPEILSTFYINDDGDIYVVLMEAEDNNDASQVRKLKKYDKNGFLISQTDLAEPEEIWDGSVLNDIYITKNNIILVSSVGIQICDTSGNTVKEIISSSKSPYYINSSTIDCDGYLYYSCYSTENIPSLIKVDLKDGSIIWIRDYMFGNYIRNICYNSYDGMVYIQDDSKLTVVDTDNNKSTEICDLRDFNGNITSDIADSSYYIKINKLLALSENEMLFLYRNIDYSGNTIAYSSELIILKKLEGEERQNAINIKTAEDKEISVVKIFLPYKDNLTKDLLYDFSKEYNIKIEVEYYSDSFMNFNIADYRQKVSTRILSGDCGWDIISTEILPYMEYAKKGYFTDLYKTNNGGTLKYSDIYYTNIFKACEYNGGLYFFPMGINFYTIITNKKNLENNFGSLQELYDACVGNSNSKNMLSAYNYTNYSSLVYQTFINYCRSDGKDIVFDKDKYLKTADLLKKIYIADIYTNHFNTGEYSIIFKQYLNKADAPPEGDIKILPGYDDGYLFNINNSYAIMADSEVTEEAAELLFYLCENIDFGSSVIRAKVLEMLDGIDANIKSQKYLFGDINTSAYRKSILDLFNKFDTLNYYDTNIFTVAYNQTELYCKGEINADTAAVAIKNAVAILNGENS